MQSHTGWGGEEGKERGGGEEEGRLFVSHQEREHFTSVRRNFISKVTNKFPYDGGRTIPQLNTTF